MGPSRLIICESQTAVIVGMRRALLKRPLPIRQTRTADEALTELRQAPRSVLVVELSAANAAEMLALVDLTVRRYPHARVLAVTARGRETYEPLLRELGAVHVQRSVRDGTALVELAHQHLQRPQPTVNSGRLTDNVVQQLPWSE